MSPFAAGIGLAIMVAGPTLYGMVSRGDLTGGEALQRGGVVAAGCVAGAAVIQRILDHYAAEQDAVRRRAAREAAIEQLRAERSATSTEPDGPTGTR